MPYITKDQVKAKRDALKKALPNYKLSITTEHYSGIKVAIMRGPSMLLLDVVMPILNEGKGESTEDGDYGMIPDYYTWVHIGKWDKPYVCTQIAGVDFSESLTQLDNLTILG